jgi:segregation and condensation protein B
MNKNKTKAAIEAILFTMGNSVELDKIAMAVGLDKENVRDIIQEMIQEYNSDDRGIKIIELDNAFQLCTKKEYYENLIKVAKAPKKQVLSEALLETLSIIAYKQPVTRLEIEKIRGVSSEKAINRLMEFDLCKELGRLDAPGRPMLFGTTEEFLRVFGVQSIDELPVISEDLVEKFKDEAELELEAEQREAESEAVITMEI